MFRSNILSFTKEIEELRSGKICQPRMATLHICYVCNQRCKGCAYKKYLVGNGHGILTWNEFLIMYEELKKLGIKAFEFCGGGEPTLLPYLIDAIELIRKEGGYAGVMTNGVEISDELAEVLMKQCSYVRISAESSNSDSYSEYKECDHNDWSKMLYNVHLLSEIKRKGGYDCYLSLKYSVNKINRGLRHYVDGIKIGEDLEVDNVQFESTRGNDLELTDNEKWHEIALLKEATQSHRLPVMAWIKKTPNDMIPQCYLNPLHLAVDYKGDVYMCCIYHGREDRHRLGNILSDGIGFWGSDEHAAKISEIDKEFCREWDCKFFHHHHFWERGALMGRHNYL